MSDKTPRRPWLPLRPCSGLLGGFLRDIRLLRLDETGHSVLKGEAIERRGLAVSASAPLHVPSLTSTTFVATGAGVGYRPRLITQPTRPPYVPNSLRPAGRAVRASPRWIA